MSTSTLWLLLMSFNLFNNPSDSLYRISTAGKVGYIDRKGKVLIPPVYFNGTEFSEGLAAVREKGFYGYIDERAQYIIPPQFDLAGEFNHGIALVYKNGEPFFIDKSGKVKLPVVYESVAFISSQKAVAGTKAGRFGIIDLHTGGLVADTVYGSISTFNNGVAVATDYIPEEERKKKSYAVIDSGGIVIVPFGKYAGIGRFRNGYSLVTIESGMIKKKSSEALIDTKGNLMFKLKPDENSWMDGSFNDGFARISLYQKNHNKKKATENSSGKNYEGYVNLKGEIVLQNPGYDNVSDFSEGRAFVQDDKGDYYLINIKFEKITETKFSDVDSRGFENGLAVVKYEEGWGLIDSMGKYIVQPKYEEIAAVDAGRKIFFFQKTTPDERKLTGIAGFNGKEIIDPFFDFVDDRGYVNGLLRAIKNNRLYIMDENGDTVWYEDEKSFAGFEQINIDFMFRGYFYASSAKGKVNTGHGGGWGSSSNSPSLLSSENDLGKDNLSVRIDTALVVPFAGSYAGYSLIVGNSTPDTISFSAQDSRLNMKLQAFYNGEWKDIEYLQSSWCGNSYHTVELPPNHSWSFSIPKYAGELKVKIRAELMYIDKSDPKISSIVYSNSIDGTVNPGQFWNKLQYTPNGIMDPYYD